MNDVWHYVDDERSV